MATAPAGGNDLPDQAELRVAQHVLRCPGLAPRNIARMYLDTVLPNPGVRVARYVARTRSLEALATAPAPIVSAKMRRYRPGGFGMLSIMDRTDGMLTHLLGFPEPGLKFRHCRAAVASLDEPQTQPGVPISLLDRICAGLPP